MSKTASKAKNFNFELGILALIMLINALSYGTIIPLLYPFASKFGINPVGLSLLFASYSLFQFLATPIIGRLSDRYGRKLLLLLSIFGTSISLALFASAQSVVMLFVARILDGITGGNNSVAQAMIADKVEGKDRVKAFGMLGAAFGFGFLIGPALGGLLSTYGITVPFYFASGLALLATILGVFFLEESLQKKVQAKQKNESLLNFSALFKALVNPVVGGVLFAGLIASLAGNAFIIGFQAYTVDILKLSSGQVGLIFTMVGVVTIIVQMFGIKVALQLFKTKERIISVSFLLSAISLFILGIGLQYAYFMIVIFMYMICNPLIGPVVSGMLSEKSNPEDQGIMLGVNQSFMSLGQIFGPITAGAVSSISIPSVFLWSGLLMIVGFIFMNLSKKSKQTVNV